MAIDILRDDPPEKDEQEDVLRLWAIDVVKKYAPIELPEEAILKLRLSSLPGVSALIDSNGNYLVDTEGNYIIGK